MIWWALGLYLIILVLIFPIQLHTRVQYCLFENSGKITLSLWKIKILEDECAIDGRAIKLQHGKKTSRVYITNFGSNNFTDRFALSFSKMLKVNTIKSDILVGVKDECFCANILAGILLTIESVALAILSTKKKIKVLRAVVLQTNLESRFDINFSFCTTICLLQIIASCIMAIVTKYKGVNYGKQPN